MAIYVVTFCQYNAYWVEANDESEAENKAYEEFKSEMTSSVAHTHYDEVIVDEIIKNEEEE